ncbi:acyl-CoA dehydrogenase/oxidase [Calycina marina]|uniref:Acyl-CoA dehydrogenase/oxidase n=1 Tax=Calycina marina TaxID=1763456 RepID=A0A9P8CGF9_9HELO|nr:acyl-CoA dehydrogenase/oxidase [Calycina marina]
MSSQPAAFDIKKLAIVIYESEDDIKAYSDAFQKELRPSLAMVIWQNSQIWGAFVQTELGQGTNIGGIETTVTLDQDFGTFIIDTAELSVTKYWPGGMGEYVVEPFMVQIHYLENHKPFPGVGLGDIGRKTSYNSADTGYVIFHKVSIPRENTLMKNSRVARGGSYT